MSARRRKLVPACEHHLVLLDRRTFLCRVFGHKWRACSCGEQRMCERCDLRAASA